MNTILGDVANCKAYLDDIVVFSSSWRRTCEHIIYCLHAFLFNASLTLNLAKCEFAKATVYLSRETSWTSQVRPVAQKVQAIVDLPGASDEARTSPFLRNGRLL